MDRNERDPLMVKLSDLRREASTLVRSGLKAVRDKDMMIIGYRLELPLKETTKLLRLLSAEDFKEEASDDQRKP